MGEIITATLWVISPVPLDFCCSYTHPSFWPLKFTFMVTCVLICTTHWLVIIILPWQQLLWNIIQDHFLFVYFLDYTFLYSGITPGWLQALLLVGCSARDSATVGWMQGSVLLTPILSKYYPNPKTISIDQTRERGVISLSLINAVQCYLSMIFFFRHTDCCWRSAQGSFLA